MTRLLLIAAILVIVLLATLACFGLPPLESFQTIVKGAGGDWTGIARSLVRATPLLMLAMSIAVAWRAGMYSIGAEGQYVVGGVCGGFAYLALKNCPPVVATLGILLACVLGGAAYSYIASLMWVKRGVNVVVSTILLNFIAVQFLQYSVAGPLKNPQSSSPMSEALPDSLTFVRPDARTDIHSGMLLALVASVFVWILFNRTKLGFVMKVVGSNPELARTQKFNKEQTQIRAMVISGALAGLAGGMTYLGITHQLDRSFSEEWGFYAIPVALLGGLSPIGILISALVYGGLFAGCEALAREHSIGTSVVFVVQGITVLCYVSAGTWLEKLKAVKLKKEATSST